MRTVSIFKAATWAGLLTLGLGLTSAIAEPLVYVPLGDEGQIAVIDAARDKIVDTIFGLPAVHGLAGTPDGRFLIAGSFEERSPGAEPVEKPAEVSLDEHAAHHGGGAEAARSGAAVSTVSVVQTADGEVVRRIDVPGAVHHVVVSPDGQLAAVTQPNAGQISIINLETYDLVATVLTGPLPNYAVFAADSARLYVSNAGNDTVSIVDTGRWIVEGNIVVGDSPEHVVLSGDGTTLYVNNIDDGTVSVIALKDRTVAKTIPVAEATLHGIDLSDDGKTLFVAALGADMLVAIDLATGAEKSLPLKPGPYHLAAVRGTGKLYISSADEPKIWVIAQNDLAVVGEIAIGGKGHQMVQGAGG